MPSRMSCKAMAVFDFHARCLRTSRGCLEHDIVLFRRASFLASLPLQLTGTPDAGGGIGMHVGATAGNPSLRVLAVACMCSTSGWTGTNGRGKRPYHQGLSGLMRTISPITPCVTNPDTKALLSAPSCHLQDERCSLNYAGDVPRAFHRVLPWTRGLCEYLNEFSGTRHP